MKRFSAAKRLFIAMILLSMTFSFVNHAYASPEAMAVRGAVKNPLSLFMYDLKAMTSFNINKVALLEERKNCSDKEHRIDVADYKGVLLSQLLEKYGTNSCDINYDSYVVVSSEDGFCATFSFGELFNSRLGNNIIIAGKINGEILEPKDGFARSVAGEDSTGGRSIKRINKIEIIRGGVPEETRSGGSPDASK